MGFCGLPRVEKATKNYQKGPVITPLSWSPAAAVERREIMEGWFDGSLWPFPAEECCRNPSKRHLQLLLCPGAHVLWQAGFRRGKRLSVGGC